MLLVLDGLGWDAARRATRTCLPELAALTGGADHHRRAVDHRRPRSPRSPPGSPPSRHGIIGFRIRHRRRRAQRLRWQLADGGARARSRARAAARAVPAAAPVPVVTKAEFRTTGFTEAHLRGADFHGWQTDLGAGRALRGARRAAARRSSTRTTRASTRSRTSTASHDGVLPGRARGRRPARRRSCSTRCPTTPRCVVTADHGQVHVGPDGWLGLAPLRRLVEAYAGDGRFRYLHAQPGAAAELARGRARSSTARDAWVLPREELLDEGWLGPDPVRRDLPARRRRRARGPRRRRRSSTRRCPYEASLRRRPRVAHRRRDAGPAASPRAGRGRRSTAVTSSNSHAV